VTDKDVKAYYDSHPKLFGRPKSREVREIRVDKVTLAQSLAKQLKQGADFAALVKKYSKDTSVKDKGGKFTVYDGTGSAYLNKVAFGLRTGQTSEPFATVHGWHIVQALAAVKPPTRFPLAQVAATIKSTLGKQSKSTKVSKWVVETKRTYCAKGLVKYGKGFQPFDDPCTLVPKSS
jgi:foldase protein PrsA